MNFCVFGIEITFTHWQLNIINGERWWWQCGWLVDDYAFDYDEFRRWLFRRELDSFDLIPPPYYYNRLTEHEITRLTEEYYDSVIPF